MSDPKNQPDSVSQSGYDDNQPDSADEVDEALVRTAARRDLAELTRKAIRSGAIRPSDEYTAMQARF
jgi:hypothetical protein